MFVRTDVSQADDVGRPGRRCAVSTLTAGWTVAANTAAIESETGLLADTEEASSTG